MADLARQLSLHPQARDEELLTAAWEKWGERCPDFLRGDFAFAVWDRRAARLFCCRDHLGKEPFFYWHDGRRFIFAGDPEILLKSCDIPRRLNRRKIAGFAIPAGQHHRHQETFFEGILSLPGGSTLKAGREGLQLHSYWQPGVSAVTVPRRPEEAFEALRETLFRSVADRLRGTTSPTLFLSGGLDSSAIAAVAARVLEQKGQTLLALTAVAKPKHRDRFGDERSYVEPFREFRNIDIRYVSAGGGPFDGIEDPDKFGESLTRSSRQYIFDAFEQTAGANGTDVVMTGNFGELGVTYAGERYCLELAARFRLVKLIGTLRQRSARERVGAFRILARDIRGLIAPDWGFQPIHLFTQAFMSESDAQGFGWSRSLDHRRFQLDLVKLKLRKHAIPGSSMMGRIPVRYPFLDKRVLEFCLSAPGDLKIRDGYSRYLVRGALNEILPPSVQWRTGKMPFATDYAARYSAQLQSARNFVASIRANDPVRNIVDVPKLQRIMDPAVSPPASRAALLHIPATIRLICFLWRFPEFQA